MTRGPRVQPLYSGTIAALVLVVTMIVVVVSGIPGGPSLTLPWSHQVTIHVEFTNADALAPHASVDIAGVKVGEVHDVNTQGNLAVATLIIDQKYSDIHSDAQVLLRPHGLFGPKYIEITPGTGNVPLVTDGASSASPTASSRWTSISCCAAGARGAEPAHRHRRVGQSVCGPG